MECLTGESGRGRVISGRRAACVLTCARRLRVCGHGDTLRRMRPFRKRMVAPSAGVAYVM